MRVAIEGFCKEEADSGYENTVQGYLAQKKMPAPWDLHRALG